MMLEEGGHEGGRRARLAPRRAQPQAREIVELEAVPTCSPGAASWSARAAAACRWSAPAGARRHRRGDRQGPAAALLARELGADALLILTDVPRAYWTRAAPSSRRVGRVTAADARLAAEGQFKAGSMGPKVEACLRFVDAGGESRDRQPDRGRPGDGRLGGHAHRAGRGRQAKGGAGREAKASGREAKGGRRPGRPAARKAAAPKAARPRPRKSTRGEDVAEVIDIRSARRGA